jgi:lysophospholipase L1-like esterase
MLGVLFAPASGHAEEREVSIVLVGDSTVADWPKEKPAHGWGQVLPPLLSSNVHLINLAICGASTKTFPATGNWQRALEYKPDFVLIQFGHNDSHSPNLPEATRAEEDYTSNLERFVSEARAASIVPVLVTPMHRRVFDPEGRPTEELGPYAEAMRRVAKAHQVPLIDLYQSSGALLTRLGDAGSVSLTVSEKDRTHFTEEGAKVMAGLVIAGMRDASPELARAVRRNLPTP